MSPTRAAVPVGIIQISLAGVLWGTGGITLQVISDRTPLSFVTISGYRMLIAAVVLVAAVLVLRRSAELVALLRASPGTASSALRRSTTTAATSTTAAISIR